MDQPQAQAQCGPGRLARGAAWLLTVPPAALWVLPVLGIIAWLWADQIHTFGGLFMASDDSYIYLGYVKRVLGSPHELFSYNIGEHSAGITGVLYYYALVGVCSLVRVFTSHYPLPGTLTLGAYVLNSGLVVVLAMLYWRAWRLLDEELDGDTSRGTRVLTCAVALGVLFANTRFIWGLFAGLENPLSATLVLAVFVSVLEQRSLVSTCILCGLLMSSRPELGAVLWVIPIIVAVRRRSAWGPRILTALAGLGILALTAAVLALPCFFATGQLLPSALDTRVHVPALHSATALLRGLYDALRPSLLWRKDWHAVTTIVLVAALSQLRQRRAARPIAAVGGLILLLHYSRAALGIDDLNIEDRYVSYLWPLHALSAGVLLIPHLRRILSRPHHLRGICGLAVGIWCAAVPINDARLKLLRDVHEMNEVVVEPAVWMASNLPPASRIAMEPAGALRVFTDFYLVDALGLTTQHARDAKDYPELVKLNKVDYMFDYPSRLQTQFKPDQLEVLKEWTPRPAVYSDTIVLVRSRLR